jgi:hypothetical protein
MGKGMFLETRAETSRTEVTAMIGEFYPSGYGGNYVIPVICVI